MDLSLAPLSPRQRYAQDLARDDFVADAAQARAVEALEQLYQQLLAPRPRWQRAAAPLGLYLWGPVGRGKSYLMDRFFAALPSGVGVRLHFHRFMRRVHAELAELSGQPDPLRRVARRLASEARVLCFDEFFVADIGDAMILARLLETLFAEGMTLVATSNVVPDQLYRDGLQRQRFLPAIALLEQHTRVLALDGGCDYRRRAEASLPFYLCPHDPAAEQALRAVVRARAQGPLRWDSAIEVLGRPIMARAVADNLLWCEFDALCEGPRSHLDYVALAERFDTLVVSRVPALGGALRRRKVAIGTEDSLDNSIGGIDRSFQQGWHDDAARRLIALVDELYDNRCRLILSAAKPIEQLYAGGRVQFEFERTVSRLLEMQTPQYRPRGET